MSNRNISISAPLGTEEDPLNVEIERGQISIETDPGEEGVRSPRRVTLTLDQFKDVVREYDYFVGLTKQKDAAE